VLNTVMRQYGFAVWVAADGQEALELYWQPRATIDVVLMDAHAGAGRSPDLGRTAGFEPTGPLLLHDR
jgi:CheY-like chemotaxis protein